MDEALLSELALCTDDPLRFVYLAYPWGEAGTELAAYDGPDTWQIELLSHIRDELARGEKIIRVAVRSGHGVGKSASFSVVTDWAMSTFEDTRGVVTANTERQLRTKTWVELAKWRRLSLTKDLFKLKATSLFSNDPEHRSEWRFDMSPWSERNTEAFAGLHNKGKRILLVMDEASGIADIVWEVAEGAMTDEDTQIIWLAMGNPTKNTGRFRECFGPDGRFAHRWKQITVDSRTSKITNKKLIDQWIKDYGLDHDFVRVRVLGQFPKHDVSSFISREAVLSALERKLDFTPIEPVVLGVDVARYGNDNSVIFPRQGRDARSRPVEIYSGLSLLDLADRVAGARRKYSASMVYVDATGLGAGLVDILRGMKIPVIEVNFSAAASPSRVQGVRYRNKRAEIWGAVRDWLPGAALQNVVIDRDYTILDDLTTTQFYYTPNDEIQLEPKEEIRRREGRSPDLADALAVTFAYPELAAVRGPALAEDSFISSLSGYNPYQQILKERHYGNA